VTFTRTADATSLVKDALAIVNVQIRGARDQPVNVLDGGKNGFRIKIEVHENSH
jgi:hypothetical protein